MLELIGISGGSRRVEFFVLKKSPVNVRGNKDSQYYHTLWENTQKTEHTEKDGSPYGQASDKKPVQSKFP